MICLGVLGDTHIPDRRPGLHTKVIPIFQAANPTAILHTGDVSIPSVLEELKAIAPVYAVQGNRDIFALRSLPIERRLEYGGVQIGMAHGHKNLLLYLKEKFDVRLRGYRLDLYLPYLLKIFPDADVILFGHSHAVENRRVNGKLLFNPGSASMHYENTPPSLGFLHISDHQVRGEILYLED